MSIKWRDKRGRRTRKLVFYVVELDNLKHLARIMGMLLVPGLYFCFDHCLRTGTSESVMTYVSGN